MYQGRFEFCVYMYIYIYIDNSGFYYGGKRYHTHLYVCVETLRKRIKKKENESSHLVTFSSLPCFLFSVMCPATHFSMSLSLSCARSPHTSARECVASSPPDCQHTHYLLWTTHIHIHSLSLPLSLSLIHSIHLWCVYSSNYLIFIFIILLVDPSSIDTLQQQQQQQQQQQSQQQPTESNFAVHEHAAMLDTIDHQQTSLINPNHLHHPQPHIHQTMPGKTQRLFERKKQKGDAIWTTEAIDHRSSYIKACICNKPVSMLFFVITLVQYKKKERRGKKKKAFNCCWTGAKMMNGLYIARITDDDLCSRGRE
jgi:hypothetical protein